MKPIAKSNLHILAHEQIHFDISELYARKLRKELKEHKNQLTLKRGYMSRVFNQIYGESENRQTLYDQETEGGQNEAQQALWKAIIEKELGDLERFRGE